MKELWTTEEKKFLKRLDTPAKIQAHLDQLIYNPSDSAWSPREVMKSNRGHCFEGCLLAAVAFEFHGHKPQLVHLVAHNDDYHTLTVYKTATGWGSVSKSNTTLLRGRMPFYKSVRELVMSYFDFYFNTKGRPSLLSYSGAVNLNRYNSWNWRTSSEDLIELGMELCEEPHFEIATAKGLSKLPIVSKSVVSACFLGADPKGLFQA